MNNGYTNPDMPDTYGYEYLQPPISQQPNYNQQQGSYWNGQQVVNPFMPNGMSVDNRRQMAQQQPQMGMSGMMGMPMMPQQQNGVTPFMPQQPQQMMPPGYGQLPNQPQPMFFGNGVGTYGVEGNSKQQPMMAFNAMAESRRALAQQPVMTPQFANPMATVGALHQQSMSQQPMFQQPMMPQIQPIQQGVPNWGPMNPYTQPQTPAPPTVNFQTQQNIPQYNQQPQAPQFPGVNPSWMEILRMNWDY